MKNTFGNSISLTVFGESHGECVGAVIDGLAAGIVVDENLIGKTLKGALRRRARTPRAAKTTISK